MSNISTVMHSFTNEFTFEKASLTRFQAERFVICVNTNKKGERKILQVFFGKHDGTLYVSMPYFAHKKCILSRATIQGGSEPSTVKLEERGKVTAHSVKFSYHPDGATHFSQDGKVFTHIRKLCKPLADVQGHIFTLQTNGLEFFDERKPEKVNFISQQSTSNLKRLELKFKLETDGPIKITGLWSKALDIIKKSGPGNYGPSGYVEGKNGSARSTFLIGPPLDWHYGKYVLAITCEIDNSTKYNTVGQMLFISGFHSPIEIDNAAYSSSMLCLSCPVGDYDTLSATIGTIDFKKT